MKDSKSKRYIADIVNDAMRRLHINNDVDLTDVDIRGIVSEAINKQRINDNAYDTVNFGVIASYSGVFIRDGIKLIGARSSGNAADCTEQGYIDVSNA